MISIGPRRGVSLRSAGVWVLVIVASLARIPFMPFNLEIRRSAAIRLEDRAGYVLIATWGTKPGVPASMSFPPKGDSAPRTSCPEVHMNELLRPVMLIDADGTVVADDRYELPSQDVLLARYRSLVIGRRFNEQAGALVRQGQLAVYPSSTGQEACQVA